MPSRPLNGFHDISIAACAQPRNVTNGVGPTSFAAQFRMTKILKDSNYSMGYAYLFTHVITLFVSAFYYHHTLAYLRGYLTEKLEARPQQIDYDYHFNTIWYFTIFCQIFVTAFLYFSTEET